MYGFVSCAYFKALFLLNKRLCSFLLLIKNLRNSCGKVKVPANYSPWRTSKKPVQQVHTQRGPGLLKYSEWPRHEMGDK